MNHVVAEFEQTFMDIAGFRKTEINGITNYYQPDFHRDDGTMHFYRVDKSLCLGIIIESAVNFQDAIRNLYEDSDCLPFDIDNISIQEVLRSHYIKENNERKYLDVTDQDLLSFYRKIVKMFADMSVFEKRQIKKNNTLCIKIIITELTLIMIRDSSLKSHQVFQKPMPIFMKFWVYIRCLFKRKCCPI